MKKILTLFIALILVAGIVSVAKSTNYDIDPDVWGSRDNTCYSNVRHVVQSSDGTIVVLYQRAGTGGLVAKKSIDNGENWYKLEDGTSGYTTIDSDTYIIGYSICIDDNDNIYVAYEKSDNVYFKKLTAQAGTWTTWTVGTERTVEDTANSIAYPSIIRQSNGRVWVSYGEDDNSSSAWLRATYSDDDFVSDVHVTTVTTGGTLDSRYPAALVIRDGDPYIVYTDGYLEDLRYAYWDGNWNSGLVNDIQPYGYRVDFSVTLITTTVHVVWFYSDTLRHTYSYNGTSWSSPLIVSTSEFEDDYDYHPSLTTDWDTDDVELWVYASIYYQNLPGPDMYSIKYKKWSGSTWPVSWTAVTFNNLKNNWPGTPFVSRGRIPVAWGYDDNPEYSPSDERVKFNFDAVTLDLTSPEAIDNLAGTCPTGDVILSWSTPGDNGASGILPEMSGYRIDYSSVTKTWDKDDYEVWIPTNGVTPGTGVSYTVASLQDSTTWYFRIWTRDEVPNWSGLSNGCTVWLSAPSQTYNWDGGGATGVWADADNWDVGGSYPDDANDKAVINTGSESISTPGAVLTIGQLELGSDYSGILTLGGNFTLDDSGPWAGNLTISTASATLDLIGYNLTIPGTFSNDGTLKLRGGQTLTFTNDTDSGTVEYVGNGDAVVDTYTIKNFGTNDYNNLTINSSGAADDVFQLGAELRMDGTLTVTSGVLYLRGYSLLDITGGATAVRDDIADTIRLYGDENVFWSTNDINSGTYEYVGDGDAAGDTYSLLDFGTTDYYNLTINSTDGATDTFRSSTTVLTTAYNFTLSSGTFTTNDGTTDRNLTVGGSVDIDGTFTANSSTITVSGNWDSSGGTFNYNTSTVDLTGEGNLTTSGSGIHFYNLKVATTTKTTTLLSHVAVADTLEIGNGTLTGPSYIVTLYKNSGAPLSHGGAAITLSRIVYRPSNGTVTVAEGNYGTLDYLELYPSLSTATFNLGGDVTVTGAFWLVANGGTTGAVCDTQNNNITATRLFFGDSSANGSTTLNCGSSIIDIGTGGVDMANNGGSHTFNLNSSTITCAGNWQLSEGSGFITQIPGTSTVTFDSTASRDITSNSQSFANVVFDSEDNNGGWNLQDSFTCSSLQISSGTLTDYGQTVTVNGDINIANYANLLVSTGTWIQGANGNISNPNVGNIFNTLQIANNVISTRTGYVYTKKIVLGTDATLQGYNTLRINPTPTDNDFIDMGSGSSITEGGLSITPPGSTTLTQKAFSASAGVVIRQGLSSTIQMTGNWSIGNLEVFGHSTADTEAEAQVLYTNGYNLTVNGFLRLGYSSVSYPNCYQAKILFSTGTHSISGEVYVDDTPGRYTYGYFDLGSADISIAGNVDFSSSTVTAGTSTVTLNGSSGQTVTSDSESFYHLEIENTGTSVQLQDAADIDGGLNVATGTLDLNSCDITISSDVSISGSGSLTCSSGEQITVGGNWSASSGATFTAVSSTTTFNGSGSFNILSSGTTFYNLVFNNSVSTWTLTDALYVLNDFTQLNGTFDTNSSGNYPLTIGDDITISGGTFYARVSTITLTGSNTDGSADWDSYTGTFTYGTSTVDLKETGTVKGSNASAYNRPFYNLTCAYPGETTTLIDTTIGVNGILSVQGEILTSGSCSIYLHKTPGSPISIVNGSTISVYTLRFRGPQNVPTYDYDTIIAVWNTGTVTQLGNVTCTGLQVTGDNFANRSPAWDTDGYTLTVNGNLLVGGTSGDPTGTHTFNANGSTITVSGYVELDHPNAQLNLSTSTMRVAGDWTIIDGNVDPGTSTVTFYGTGTSTLKGSTTFYVLISTTSTKTVQVSSDTVIGVTNHLNFENITLQSTSPGATWYLNLQGTQDVHHVDVRDSNASGGNTIFARSSTDLGNNTNWIFDDSILTWDGSESIDWDTAENWNFNIVPLSTHTVIIPDGTPYDPQLTSNVIISSITIQTGGQLSLNEKNITVTSDVYLHGSLICAVGEQITVGGNWSAYSGATFTTASSTTTFNGNGSFNILSSGTTFYNLAFSNSISTWTLTDALYSAGDFTLTNSGNVDSNDKNLTIAGDFTINGGKFTAGASAIAVGGNWDSSAGTFTYGTSTVDLTGTGNLKTTGGWDTAHFRNLKVAAANETTTIQSHVGVTDTLTLGNATGTLTDGASSFNITLFKNSGEPLDHGGATISVAKLIYRPSNGTVTVAGGNYGTLDYLELYPSSSGVTFNLGGNVTVTGAFWLVVGAEKTVVCNTQNYDLTATRLYFGDSAVTGSTTLNCGSSIIDIGTGGVDMANNGGAHPFNLNSATVTCAGNWELVDGTGTITQNWGTSTVTFDGTGDSTLTGSTTFYVLISTTSTKTVQVSSDTVIDVTNHLNFENITLQSTSPGATWYLNLQGTQDVSGVDVRDSNASGGDTILDFDCPDIEACYYGNNTNWDFGPPAAITDLTGLCNSDTGNVTLYWSTPGDDEWTGVLSSTSEYRIDYSTDSSRQWDKDTYEVSIPTYGVTPYTEVSRKITGLTGGTTWYFRIWTADEIPLWSDLSNGCTVWVTPILSVSISTDTYNFGELNASTAAVSTANITVTNDGNVPETYSIKSSSFTTRWVLKDTPGNDEFTLQAAFHPSEPNNDDIDWESDDILTESLQQCTTAAFSIDNSQNGKNVSPFTSNIRDFWLRVKTPLSTSTTTQQSITITISTEQGSP